MCRTEGMISKEIGKVPEGIYVCTGRRKLCLGRKEESHEEKKMQDIRQKRRNV